MLAPAAHAHSQLAGCAPPPFALASAAPQTTGAEVANSKWSRWAVFVFRFKCTAKVNGGFVERQHVHNENSGVAWRATPHEASVWQIPRNQTKHHRSTHTTVEPTLRTHVHVHVHVHVCAVQLMLILHVHTCM